jgi:DNA-binding CsgD family transcriptional regulator
VQSHVKNILAKLGVHSKVEAVRIAWRHGLATTSRSVAGAG